MRSDSPTTPTLHLPISLQIYPIPPSPLIKRGNRLKPTRYRIVGIGCSKRQTECSESVVVGERPTERLMRIMCDSLKAIGVVQILLAASPVDHEKGPNHPPRVAELRDTCWVLRVLKA